MMMMTMRTKVCADLDCSLPGNEAPIGSCLRLRHCVCIHAAVLQMVWRAAQMTKRMMTRKRRRRWYHDRRRALRPCTTLLGRHLLRCPTGVRTLQVGKKRSAQTTVDTPQPAKLAKPAGGGKQPSSQAAAATSTPGSSSAAEQSWAKDIQAHLKCVRLSGKM